MTVFCCLVFGRVTRYDRLSKTILQGTLGGGRRRGRQKKCWMDNLIVRIPARARIAHNGLGLLQERLKENLC